MNDTDDILEYYELENGQRVAEGLPEHMRAQWRTITSLPTTVDALPRPPSMYHVTVRQFLLWVVPLFVYALVTTPPYIIAVDTFLGDSIPAVIVGSIVGCGSLLLLGVVVLVPLGSRLAGVPIVVEHG